ncbi:hypothetical protein AB4043_13730, partial [Terriglobus sp. YAF25]|uniref:hypothetical protein n=1 Tax=Terriglobus sp. YAF25 TaxID=3233080 RepID=UPI003F9AADCC
VERLEAGNLGGHLERVEILAVVGELGLEGGSLRVLLVEGGALDVFLGERGLLEIAACFDDAGVVRDFAADVGDGDACDLAFDDGALGGVIVDEDEGVGAEVELSGDGLDVLMLRVPVGLEAGDVLEFQDRVGMLKTLLRYLLVVLGVLSRSRTRTLRVLP